MSVIDDFLSKVEAPQRAEFNRVRKITARTVPEAKEVITYGMPGFKYKNKYLISFGSFKNHMSLFPGSGAIEILEDELSGYKLARGTIQFTLEKPLPDALIEQIVAIRLEEILNDLK